MTGKLNDERVLRLGEIIEIFMNDENDETGLAQVPSVRLTIRSGDKIELNLQCDPISNKDKDFTKNNVEPSENMRLGSIL